MIIWQWIVKNVNVLFLRYLCIIIYVIITSNYYYYYYYYYCYVGCEMVLKIVKIIPPNLPYFSPNIPTSSILNS